MRFWLVLVSLMLASGSLIAADDAPLRKVDLMRIVGRPVLDADTTAEGLFVYLHQGRLFIAATARKDDIARGKKSTYQLRLTTEKTPTQVELGAFSRQKARGSKETWLLSIHVGKRAQKMSLKVDAEVVISDVRVGAGGRTSAAPILLGPLGRRGATSVSLGRY